MNRWADVPPPSSNSRYDWPDIVRQLRRRPGKWMLVREQATRSMQSSIKRGRIRVLRDDTDWVYDCRVRNTVGSKADLWMSARRRDDEPTPPPPRTSTRGKGDAAESGD